MFEAQTISNAKNPGHFQGNGTFSFCNNDRFKHGLLLNAIVRKLKMILCNKLTLGVIPIQHVAYGC
jgi:hypothetical protein